MLSCLRTGDEQSAHLCLQRLTERFGAENERLMALRGVFQEATAKDDAALKTVLEEYEKIIATDPSNMVCRFYMLCHENNLLIRAACNQTTSRTPSDT
jgi:hypothetical protein